MMAGRMDRGAPVIRLLPIPAGVSNILVDRITPIAQHALDCPINHAVLGEAEAFTGPSATPFKYTVDKSLRRATTSVS